MLERTETYQTYEALYPKGPKLVEYIHVLRTQHFGNNQLQGKETEHIWEKLPVRRDWS